MENNHISEELEYRWDNKMNLEINKLLELVKIIHLSLVILSIIVLVLTYIPNIIDEDIKLVIRTLDIGFFMMISLNYYLNAPK